MLHDRFKHVAIATIQETFPRTLLTVCFFHFRQCIWCKIQQFGLVVAYEEENGKFAINACSLATLVFVSGQGVENTFGELITDEDFDQRVQPIAGFFKDTWIG